MDLIIGRSVKFSYSLIPRNLKYFSKLPLFLVEQRKATSYCHIQYLGITSLHRSNGINTLSNRCDTQFKQLSTSFPVKTNTSQYGTCNRPNSSEKSTTQNKQCSEPPAVEKQSLFQRMKQMTKDYWHILIPVHIVTSIGWAGVFYSAAKNGVDIAGMLESLNLSEKYLEMVRGSSAGHWAVAYALYKIATPARYTVTLGGTTMCIRYLNKWGYMKFKDTKLNKSLKSARQHISSYGKSNLSSKVNQPPPPKT
ncbi:uncharacterized protein C18orf19 homolog A [Copidosoma floridanum]|uniref:uncharacterized protein C18orf19 homolog A n=1 Tax=Copidosoma floridanum TaxID=29053 RepID=UPI0006C96CB7|nr:uncharacterized protein C18orf19 homolog A [Copidosoma floridanum]